MLSYNYISKLFMPPNSTDRFLTAPIRAIRSSRKHLYLVFCQEPIRRPPGLLGLLEALKALEPSGALGLLKLLKPSKPLEPLV